MPSWFRKILETRPSRGIARLYCWTIFFPPLVLLLVQGLDQLLDQPQTLDVGVVAVSAVLGGLVLNAGLSLRGPKGREFISVAQKFIAVVILMILSVPSLQFVELMDGIDINACAPDSLEAWVRGFFFWVGAISFFGGIIFFIVALVDLVYAMVGIGSMEHAPQRKHETSDRTLGRSWLS